MMRSGRSFAEAAAPYVAIAPATGGASDPSDMSTSAVTSNVRTFDSSFHCSRLSATAWSDLRTPATAASTTRSRPCAAPAGSTRPAHARAAAH